MSETTNDTTTTSDHDPIRPAHYRDPATGRDRIAVWNERMISDDFLAAIAATVDRYLSRAGRKPGVPAEQDHAKAAEVVRRYYEEWGDGAQEELRCLLHDLGHSREAIDALLHAAEQPRTATPPAEVTPQQDAGAMHPTTGDVHFNVDFYGPDEWLWSVQIIERRTIAEGSESTEDEARSKAKAAQLRHEGEQQRNAQQANPLAGVVTISPGSWFSTGGDDGRPLGATVVLTASDGVRFPAPITYLAGIVAYYAIHAPDLLRLNGRQQQPAAQDDHAAALHPTRHQVSFALSALSDALGAAEEAGNQYVVDAVNAATEALEDVEAQQDAERERERADRAERALRLERGTPQPGDLPEGWRREPCTPRSYVNGTAKAVCLETGEWRWWCREGWGRSTTAAEAIDAAHAAITAQRSDDSSAQRSAEGGEA